MHPNASCHAVGGPVAEYGEAGPERQVSAWALVQQGLAPNTLARLEGKFLKPRP